ncbi:serine/threonine-protein kinase [Zavarzinella formosa]|uniref:serine/threonine-protein kinase n=1 Tax=Zavarzinella formosa TaxID=360055 RepID=UPI0012F9239F|nr:serine/threonine-protein kinase [Zavarzinella formosa]
MPDSDPTFRLVKPLKPGQELSSAARSSDTRRLTAGSPPVDGEDDIFTAGSAFVKQHSHAESFSHVPPFLGPYRILRPLGRGGMSRVFLAEHQHLRRQVAIKILPKSMAADPVMRERFKREARVVAALDHPNIVRAYDLMESDGFHFFVMEYVAGRDLDRVLRESGSLSTHKAVKHAIKAATGLNHAHERQMIHRDVKPGNLLLDETGTIKILDLGLARFNGELDDQLTARLDKGTVICTPEYAAPEQIIDPDKVDQRADVYSLGATLYALLTGRSPFHDQPTRHLTSVRHREAPPLHHLQPEIPRALSGVVRRMMAGDPARRPTNMDEVIRLLEPWSEPQTLDDTVVNLMEDTVEQSSDIVCVTLPDPQSPEPEPARPVRRLTRRPIISAAACVLGLSALVAWANWRTPETNEGTPTANQLASVSEPSEPTRTVLWMDFRAMEPGSATVNRLAMTEMAGAWPSKWNLTSVEGTTGRGGLETAAEEARLFVETIDGPGHTQLELGRSLASMQPGRHYRCRVAYRCPQGLRAEVFSIWNSDRSFARRLAETPDGEGTVEWLESPATPARLSVGFTAWKAAGGARLEVRSVEIIEEDFDPAIGRAICQLNPRMMTSGVMTRAVRGGEIARSGAGRFPEEWSIDPEPDCSLPAMVAVETGSVSRVISVAEGTSLFTPDPQISLARGHTYLVRYDYRLPSGGRASLGIGLAAGQADFAELPLGEQSVSRVSQAILKPDHDGPAFLSFRHEVSPGFGTRARGTLHLRSLEILDLTPESDSEIVYRLETPARGFLTKMRGDEPVEGGAPGTWPGLWSGRGRGIGTADFQFAPPGSGEIVALRGNGSIAEMHSSRPLAKLVAGRRYEVRVTYRTDGGGTGMLDIKDARQPMARHGATLNDTRGEWQITTRQLSPDRDMAVRIGLRNDGTTPEKTLRIRELVIRDAGPATQN